MSTLAPAQSVKVPATTTILRQIQRLIRLQPLGAISAVILLTLVLTAIFAPQVAQFDPIDQNRPEQLKPPGGTYFFGTDHLGRDVFSRVVFGARTSLAVGLLAVVFGSIFGGLIGVVSGYFGSTTDLILQRLIDAIMSFPTIILAMVIIAVLGQGVEKVIAAIAIVETPRIARVVRGAVLAIKEQVYVEAARTVGCGHTRIMLQYILPNAMAPLIVMATGMLGQAILIEASLSFLGLGTPPPTPSWGSMLSDSGRNFLLRAPWIATFPGLAMTFSVLSINLLGDALRDMLDPRLRGSR